MRLKKSNALTWSAAMHAWMVMKLFRPIRPIADDFDQEVEAPRRLNSYDGLNNPPPLNSSVTLRLSDYGLVERYFKGSILRPAWGMGSATLQNERQLQNPSFFLPGENNDRYAALAAAWRRQSCPLKRWTNRRNKKPKPHGQRLGVDCAKKRQRT